MLHMEHTHTLRKHLKHKESAGRVKQPMKRYSTEMVCQIEVCHAALETV